jgi:hypothetical protein
VLLDECVTCYLKKDFGEHVASTVEEAGLKGLKNGRLLEAARGRFDALITVDQKLQYQQNLSTCGLVVIVLKAPRSTYPMLQPLMPKVLAGLEGAKPGEVIVVS